MLKPRAGVLLPVLALRERARRGERPRVPEPMVMEEPESVADFHAAGADDDIHAAVHELGARSMSRLLPAGGTVLDLGVGSGRLAVRLARHRPDARIVGLDLSERMLATAGRLAEDEGVADRVSLRLADLTDCAAAAPEEVALVSSSWALHHLPDAAALSRCLHGIASVCARTGCAVWLFDLARMRHPASQRIFSGLIVGADERRATIEDGIASEAAAWTFEEMREALADAGLGGLRSTRSAPFPWLQAHWCHGRVRADGHRAFWRPISMPPGVRADYVGLRSTMRGLPRQSS